MKTMLHPRRSSDMFYEQTRISEMNVPIDHQSNEMMMDMRIPRTISITKFTPAATVEDPHYPTKPSKSKNTDLTPQKPVRLSPSDLLERKAALTPPRRNPSPKRSKPRRQSGVLCRGRNPETLRSMMMLMRTDSDRQILRNTLERKLQGRRPSPPRS